MKPSMLPKYRLLSLPRVMPPWMPSPVMYLHTLEPSAVLSEYKLASLEPMYTLDWSGFRVGTERIMRPVMYVHLLAPVFPLTE
jgi:hypothetical protein